MRFCSIASGSSGNCIYVGSDNTHVLVDIGISGKKMETGLNSLELTGRDLDGILITHEHSDSQIWYIPLPYRDMVIILLKRFLKIRKLQ